MVQMIQSNLQILRLEGVKTRTQLSRSTIYDGVQKGTFPRPVKLGPRAVGWLENEIEEWLVACVENRDSGEEVENG